VIVDLRTEEHTVVGNPGDMFVRLGDTNGLPWTHQRRSGTARVAALRDYAQWLHSDGPRTGRTWLTYFDARTAKPIAQGWSDMRFEAVERLQPKRAPSPPDGYHIWGAPRGLGYTVYDNHRRRHYWDPFRGKVYPARGALYRFARPVIRPGRWLAMIGGKYELFDPDTLEHEPTRGTPIAAVSWVLDDGRVAAWTGERMGAIDPETGEEQAFGPRARYGWCFGRTSGGAYCVRFEGRDGKARYARIDSKTLEATYANGLDDSDFLDFQLVAVIGEDTMIGIYKRRQVVRVRFGSDTRTVLWPR
jgi:hypothetical protein